jgi:hypothetical protein
MSSGSKAPWLFLIFVLLSPSISLHSQTALQLVNVPPCRVVDTRQPSGPFGGPVMSANSARSFAIPQGACNIPSSAAAYSLNVTVVPRGSLNYLTAWPTGQTQPVVSTLNSYDGRVKANAAIIPAGSNGAVSVYVTNTTDVILDIDGYFAPAAVSTMAFLPLTPCRVADTRGPSGPLGGPAMTKNQQRDFPVLASACNIPDNAQAYSLNFTVIPKTTLGYLTVWPTGESQMPVVSTLNAPTGTVVANAALVPAGTSGAISVFASDATDVIIDINGYFASDLGTFADGMPSGLSLYPMTPCRVLDTRPPGSGTFSGMIPVNVLGSTCSVPAALAYVFNATVVPQNGPMGYLTLWPDAEGMPVVSTLNAYDGAVTSNMAIVPTLNGDVDAFAYNPTNLIMDIFSYFAPVQPLTITTAALPNATLNYAYATTLTAAGGVQPYSWSVTSGSLPNGVTLNSQTGMISGTPAASGNYPFTVQVTDSESQPASISTGLAINVSGTLAQLTITTASLPSGTQNSPYSTALAATGGVTPYAWSIASGVLPSGLSLNPSTGVIGGTPNGGGVSSFTVKVTDSELPSVSVTMPLSITITSAVPLSITTTSLPGGTTGSSYYAPLAAIGGVYPYSWSIFSGSLPGGLLLNSTTGSISGTPLAAGNFNFTVQVTDGENPPASTTASLGITIAQGGGGDPGKLNGDYAFYLHGFSTSGAWTLAGSFIADGHGTITSGVLDGNSVAGQPYTVTFSGTYSITTVGLNTITLQASGRTPMTLAFVLDSTGNGRIIEYDDTTGSGSRGSGLLRKATASAFSLSALNGSWVLGTSGSDNGTRDVQAGQFTLNSGTISNGTGYENDGGTFKTSTFSGTVAAVNTQTGRATVTIQSSLGTAHEVIYVVSTGEMVITNVDSSGPPIQAGQVLQQSGSFSKSSLNGAVVVYGQDINTGSGGDESEALILSFNGNGNFTFVAGDDDYEGTIQSISPFQGTYTVAANGAVAITQQGGGTTPAFFLVSQNKCFGVGRGDSADFDWMEPQTGGLFSDSSMSGSYVGGSLPPLDYANAGNEIEAGSANGSGTLIVSGDSSGSGGLDHWTGTNVTYNISSNGRGTAEAQGDNTPSIVYMISPTKFVVLMPRTDARIDLFTH